MATGVLESHTSLAAPAEIWLLSFSIFISLPGTFPGGPCVGHRPSLGTSLWGTVPLEQQRVREGCFPKGRGAEQTKHGMSMIQWSSPLVCLVFLFLGPFCWGSCQSSSKYRAVTLKAQTHGELQSCAGSWLPLFRSHDSLALWAGPNPLCCSGNAILRSSGAGRAWQGSRLWSVSS